MCFLTPMDNEISDVSAAIRRLEAVRARFDVVLRADRERIRRCGREGYGRYESMIEDFDRDTQVYQREYLAKLRSILKAGLLREADPTNGPDWVCKYFMCPVPREVVEAMNNPHARQCDVDLGRRMAAAFLDYIDTCSQISKSTSPERRERLSAQWRSRTSSTTHVEVERPVWFRLPPGVSEPTHPAALTWNQFMELSTPDRLHLAYARLALLHDVYSLSPTIPRPESVSPPMYDGARFRFERIWPSEYEVGDESNQFSPMTVKPLNPSKLHPRLAEAMMDLIEEDAGETPNSGEEKRPDIPKRLTYMENIVWEGLFKAALEASELASLKGFDSSAQAARQLVRKIKLNRGKDAIKRRNGFGYYRPDAPPNWDELKPKKRRTYRVSGKREQSV